MTRPTNQQFAERCDEIGNDLHQASGEIRRSVAVHAFYKLRTLLQETHTEPCGGCIFCLD